MVKVNIVQEGTNNRPHGMEIEAQLRICVN